MRVVDVTMTYTLTHDIATRSNIDDPRICNSKIAFLNRSLYPISVISEHASETQDQAKSIDSCN